MQRSSLSSGDVSICYYDHGSASRAIVFVHGSSGSSDIWKDQFGEARLAGYRLVAIDLPGHGNSGRAATAAQYELPQLGHAIVACIRQLALSDYIIVAFSLGASLVAEVAQQLEDCKGFFLVGASILNKDTPPGAVFLPTAYGHVLTDEDPETADLNGFFRGMVLSPDAAVLEMLSAAYRNTDPLFRRNMGGIFQHQRWGNEIDNLRATHKPVALVYGTEEKGIQADFHLQQGFLLWRGKLHRISNAGHFAQLDQPRAFNDLLVSFAGELLGRSAG